MRKKAALAFPTSNVSNIFLVDALAGSRQSRSKSVLPIAFISPVFGSVNVFGYVESPAFNNP